MESTRIHIVVPHDLLTRVDGARGDVPRSTFVRRAVEAALGGPGAPAGGKTTAGPAAAPADRTQSPRPSAPPRASGDDIRRCEPDSRMFNTAADHRRAMARFNAKGEW